MADKKDIELLMFLANLIGGCGYMIMSYRRHIGLLRSQVLYGAVWSNSKKNHESTSRRFWIRPDRTSEWWYNWANEIMLPEEWKENFRMSRTSLLKLERRIVAAFFVDLLAILFDN